jgi:pimeloyl-ACP methyl ester carboxylesterase
MSLPLDRRRIRVSGGDLAYVDLGEGPAVLLLHGFPTSAFLWRREAWLLAQRMRVIAPDLLGYGGSEKPRYADLSEPAQAGYVRELLDLLGISEVAVVGHDIGGVVSQLLALDHPDLAIPAMVLLDTPSFDAWPIQGVKMLREATPDQESGEFVHDVIRLTFDLGVRHEDLLDEATFKEYLEPFREDPKAFFRAVRGIEGKGLAGREDDLASLDLRLFLLWGEDDPFVPTEIGERLNDLVSGSTLALLPGCSHFVTEDAPATVGPLIYAFLRTAYLGDQHAHVPES